MIKVGEMVPPNDVIPEYEGWEVGSIKYLPKIVIGLTDWNPTRKQGVILDLKQLMTLERAFHIQRLEELKKEVYWLERKIEND